MAAYACKKVSDALPEINAFKAQQALSRHINGGLLALCQNDIADKRLGPVYAIFAAPA